MPRHGEQAAIVALDALASRESRMRVLTQENSGGPAAPRNRGIGVAEGEFVCFLDPDDYW